jgi:hypothetical protein
MDLPRASHPRVRPLHTEQARVRRCGLIIIHEVAYEPAVRPWSSRFGDKVVAVATMDGIVHHADVVTLKGFEWDWAPT